MQGVFDGSGGRRFPTKKSLKEAADEAPSRIHIEATSAFGNEFDGPVLEAPEDKRMSVVGPDPYTKRNWYATVVRQGKKVMVS